MISPYQKFSSVDSNLNSGINNRRNKMGKQVYKHGYSCKLDRVVDGDTADAMIDLGFNVWHT